MRNLKHPIKMLGLAAIVVVFSATMFAGLSPVIYNTGVNAGGLIPYPGPDGIYSEFTYGLTPPVLTSSGQAPTGFTSSGSSVIEDPNIFPISGGPWVPNTSTAQWITTPDDNAATADPDGALGAGGYYVYTEAFTMNGFSPIGATLAGNFAADNGATAYLNGNLIGTTASFTTLTGLSNGAGDFKAGTNFLSFIVFNAPNGGVGHSNPTGLFVDSLAITATPSTPEPAFYGVLAIGLAGLFVAARSRKAVKA
jgi:hypothetical protein